MRAVMSVIDQTFADFELIIIDDGSVPPVRPNLAHDASLRVRIIRSERNLGAAGARNLGLRYASGRYISFLDDDDQYARTFLEKSFGVLEGSARNVACCWCGVKFVNYNLENPQSVTTRVRRFLTSSATDQKLFSDFLSIGTGFGLTLKAELLREIGTFNCRLRYTEDTELFVRMLQRGFRPAIVPGVQAIIHNHHQPRLTDWRSACERISETNWILRQYQDFFGHHVYLKHQLLAIILTCERELAAGRHCEQCE